MEKTGKMNIKNKIKLGKNHKTEFDCSSSNTSNSWSESNFELEKGAKYDVNKNCVGWQKAAIEQKFNKGAKKDGRKSLKDAAKKGDFVALDKAFDKFDSATKSEFKALDQNASESDKKEQQEKQYQKEKAAKKKKE